MKFKFSTYIKNAYSITIPSYNTVQYGVGSGTVGNRYYMEAGALYDVNELLKSGEHFFLNPPNHF